MTLLSIISLEVKICKTVNWIGLYAACNGDISGSSLFLILLIMHAARILRREDRRIIVFRFSGGYSALFGF